MKHLQIASKPVSKGSDVITVCHNKRQSVIPSSKQLACYLHMLSNQTIGSLFRHSATILIALQASHPAFRSLLQFPHLPPRPPNSNGGPGRGSGPSGWLSMAIAATPSMPQSLQPIVLTLASFTVTKMAYVRITRIFREEYMSLTGLDVRFRLTFTGSGVQARAVIDGLPADLVALALPLDVNKIVEAGLIDPSWRRRYPNNSMVCETTVALVVRAGNPKNIRGWNDLLQPGVEIVVANPKTAGVARWIFLALWGVRMHKGDEAATEFVRRVFGNVIVQPRDAREASDVFFKQKVGDVLLTYENEVILTNHVYADKALPYVIPSRNIRIECPLSLVDKVIDQKGGLVRKVADDFAKYLFTFPAQREFANVGFRVNSKVCKKAADLQVGIPNTRLWNVDKELGGWEKAQAKLFDAGKVLDQIQEEAGRMRVEQRR